MLYKLSTKYQKEIALSFISLFFISGLNSLKAQINTAATDFGYANNYSNYSFKQHENFNQIFSKQVEVFNDKSSFTKKYGDEGKNTSKTVEPKVNLFGKKRDGEPTKTNIGGPNQPEMAAFKSVGSDNMVSPFTGDFSYNIPLLDVGGYPVNMFYNSGITMDQESSWVGLGWNINPGTINRNLRGIPDDFDGSDIITKKQNFKPDRTWGVDLGENIKFYNFPVTLGLSEGLSYNNKLGVAIEGGLNVSLSISKKSGDGMTGSLSVGLNASSRDGSNVTPSVSMGYGKKVGVSGNLGLGVTYSSRQGLSSMHVDAGISVTGKSGDYYKIPGLTDVGGGSFSVVNSNLSFAYPAIMPTTRTKFTRSSYSLSTSQGGEIYGLNLGMHMGGYFTQTRIAPEDKISYHKAYGMLNYQLANKDETAMLDFNRANDGIYTPNSPAIGMPIYTYDAFNITGEGIGGSFRAYRSDLGYMRDGHIKTKEESSSFGLDLGFGNLIHGGADLSQVYSPTEVGGWKANNEATSVFNFQQNDKDYQASYLKNPGEKAIPDANFQNNIGGENLVRLKLGSGNTPMLLPTFVKYDNSQNNIGEQALAQNLKQDVIKLRSRDKRTQVISFLTADEATRVGFDKKIYSYNVEGADSNKIYFSTNCNRAGIDSISRTKDPIVRTDGGIDHTTIDPYRKKHHISEIDVLGTDGKKYVYGIPVYNIEQTEATFSINNGNNSTGKSTYEPGTDDGVDNKQGRDWLLDEQEMPAYTSSFLLTELVSSNYIDVKGDGITEDDMGDAIKFNYSRFEKGYQWRTPIGGNSASYSEGLKTDTKDDKAHYIFGKREMWHLYSIESKNMLARFFVKNDRKDCRQVASKAGELDNTWGMQRLDRICLYSKGDLMKYGDNAKPIKTVKFFQSYKLCQGIDNSVLGYGKLTLDSIWIFYNGNGKKAKSKYVFYYPTGDKNPSYIFNGSDRWGNYKSEADNPPGLKNAEYPYVIQNKNISDRNSAAWTMNKILLPSGGIINVDYESDTYAYVQNKRAATMCQIIGMGKLPVVNLGSSDLNNIYTNKSDGGDNEYVFVKLPYSITSNTVKQELNDRYFKGVTQLYMRLAVNMPSGFGTSGIAGYENIPVYGDIDDFGLAKNTSGVTLQDVAWVRIKRIDGGATPMTQQALQFLRKELPGKAFKGYDVSEESGTRGVIMALAGMVASVKELQGEDKYLKDSKKCKTFIPLLSFARMNCPTLEKFGGGLRVKKVVIQDNWDKMKGTYAATYGQEYKYTTTEFINGRSETISSGVAAWEPSIGADENPFKEIMRYQDHNKGGPFDFGAVEMPLGEMFYPAANVGYSKIEVISIHRDTVKNKPTRQVSEFYTTKDFPFKSTCTQLIQGQSAVTYEPPKILQILKIDCRKAITLSQGFLVDMNDMNGKEKSTATYSALDSINPISSTTNYYNTTQATNNTYSFNHNFPTLTKADGVLSNSLIGRDIEVMADFRQHKTETITGNLNVGGDGSIWGEIFVFIPNIIKPFAYQSMTYRSSAVLKVVNHYGMLDSVVVIDKGSQISTKNLVYDAETGNVLLTRTENEHKKPIYNFSYPAHWAYSGMGAAYKNIDAQYKGLTFRHGTLITSNTGIESVLESGDELYVVAENNTNPAGQLPCDVNVGTDPWTTLQKSNGVKKIWAVNANKIIAPTATPIWVFMDADGNPYNAVDVYVRIIRSGHRNMLDQIVGNITTLQDPRAANGQLIFNDVTKVLQSSAATFKDNWRVDNAFYKLDSTVDISTYATVKKKEVQLDDYVNVYHGHRARKSSIFCGSGYDIHDYSATKDPFLLSRKWGNLHGGGGCLKPEVQITRGFLQFNYASGLPNGYKLYKSLLSLYSHTTINRNLDPSIHITHNLHGANSSHSLDAVSMISAIKSNWFPVPNNAAQWAQTYVTNTSVDNYVTNTKAVMQYPPIGNKDYTYIPTSNGFIESRIPVTNVVAEAATSVLGQNGKVGFRLNVQGDQGEFGDEDYHCYWTVPTGCDVSQPFAPPGSQNYGDPNTYAACSSVIPTLSYYYYVCGNTDSTPNSNHDPYLNRIIKCTNVSVLGTFCPSKFSRKAINPYVEGILGNWRVDSTYAYYGERKEGAGSLADPVDTRIGGTIINYKGFWNFANSSSYNYISRNTNASDVWVWNSTITQYNRKGYEIENKDPLGRFNSGLYGYNQQLPIAVANNARVQEILFDGFEDYDYQTAQSCITCKPHRSFNYSSTIQPDNTEKHTGQYSLKVNNGAPVNINAPVVPVTEADKPYSLNIQAQKTSYTGYAVDLSNPSKNGKGLQAKYYNHPYGGSQTVVPLEPDDVNSVLIYTDNAATVEIPGATNVAPKPNVTPEYFSVQWKGLIQAPATGMCIFNIPRSDNGYRIKFNGQIITPSAAWTNGGGINFGNTTSVAVQAGQTYAIEISYYNNWGGYEFQKLKWNMCNGSTSFVPIDIRYLYTPGSTVFNTVLSTSLTCDRLDSVQVTGHALTDTFSILQGSKMLLSAWVKEGGNDCKCVTYAKNNITITYTGSSQTDIMQPAGSIIEGWQRYEASFTVPATATALKVALNNNSGSASIPVFFDDIRIEPFNSTMKSFVYHSSNLRLMSELDENNYASFYEYDDDGTLTRVKKETAKGIKTITETRSSLQKVINPE